jgi:hypothetical protein
VESVRQTLTSWLQSRPTEEVSLTGRVVRTSLGLEQFVESLGDVTHPAVLDLGRVWNSTVSFFTGLGCKLYTEDLFQSLYQALNESGPDLPPLEERFLGSVLQYPEESLRGILAWDFLDYLPEPLLAPVALRLFDRLEPGGAFLGFFHDRAVNGSASFARYRVLDPRTVELLPGSLPLKQQRSFANRALLQLFEGAHSSRTFVGRDHLREFFVVK